MLYDILTLSREGGSPLYLQLYASLRQAIEQDNLKKGERLPSIRKLSGDLGISRTTVEAAYQQLCVEGYIKSSPQRGYYVLTGDAGPFAPQHSLPYQEPAEEPAYIRYSFGSDSVDMHNMDFPLWRKYIKEILGRGELLASYGDPQGEAELRDTLCQYAFGVRGVVSRTQQIVIGAGTQPLLYLLCGLLRGEGHAVVAMEEPGFPQAKRVFEDCGIEVLCLPTDEEGVRMDALEQSGAKLLFISPSNQVQTGSTIPMTRRMEILGWAKQAGALVIEDDYNGELRYKARPIPCMQGMGDHRNVAYIGSFSKLLLPSVRIGYLVLPEGLLQSYQERAKYYNQTASKLEQLALARYIREGHLEKQLRRTRKLYALKSQQLADCLAERFGKRVDILLQETALCLAVTVHGNFTQEELVERAKLQGVRVMPFGAGSLHGGATVLLSFAGIRQEEMADAVSCLQEAWG